MDETTFRDSNSFLINGKSFTVRYFPSTETTILVRTNSIPISQQELSQVTGIDSVITSDGGINYGEIITTTNSFASLGAPQEFLSDFANNSQIQQTVLDTARTVSGQSQPTPTAQNPAQQGGSTPIAPTPTTANVGGIMRYPLTMDDGQDKIKFVPLELIKSSFSEGDELTIKKPTYNALSEETMYIGIQGGITDSNGVTWGSGELNEIQRFLANKSLGFMNNPTGTMQDLQKELEDAFKNKGILSTARGLGQLYFAEQATGVGGLLSRATGQVLNPNLELLFQNPTLRTFQFQFKMSPRNKREADVVKKIIKTFKRRMAVKKSGLFLKAPNVFKIEYQKGMSQHQSINLIKECALLNFSVDYTPNGSYMTFGDGENGDPEASMVTYALSMAFQEIEPIYDVDYTEGEEKDHPVGY